MKIEQIEDKKLKIKRMILYVFLAIVLLIIFLFSGEPGKKSQNTSDKFTSSIINITNKDISASKKNEIIKNSRFIIRKAAHFTIYFVLGTIVFLLINTYNINNKVLISIILCFIFGCLDELHQVFIPGRTARIYDCVIDTIGSSVSILLLNTYYIIKLKNKK